MKALIVLCGACSAVATSAWHWMPAIASDVIFMSGLFVTGVLASFVNMVSGGGSMIVLGFLMLMGVDPVVANATNRVGVLVSTATGAAAFRSEKKTEFWESLKLGMWSIPGGIVGAIFSISIEGEIYEKILAVVMIFIVASMFFPKRSGTAQSPDTRRRWTYPAMILVGLYGGLIQVGVGIIIFAVLRHLGNMSLMRINVHRVFIVLIFIVPSMAVFIYSGKVNWAYAVALCAGNAAGSWIAVKFTVKKGEKVIRYGMVVSVAFMSLKFLIF